MHQPRSGAALLRCPGVGGPAAGQGWAGLGLGQGSVSLPAKSLLCNLQSGKVSLSPAAGEASSFPQSSSPGEEEEEEEVARLGKPWGSGRVCVWGNPAARCSTELSP